MHAYILFLSMSYNTIFFGNWIIYLLMSLIDFHADVLDKHSFLDMSTEEKLNNITSQPLLEAQLFRKKMAWNKLKVFS